MANAVSDGASLFNSAIDQTKAAVGSKPVWITETGWPVSGPTQNQAVASVDNAKTYWDDVGCPLFESTNVWWYTLQDAAPDTPSPSFGLVGSTLTTTPLYDLSCNSSSSSPASSASVSGAPSATGSVAASASGFNAGSPGISGGVGTATGSASSPTGVAPGGSGSGSSSGSGSGASNATYTVGSSSPSSTVVTTNSASSNPVSFAAALLAVLVVSFAL